MQQCVPLARPVTERSVDVGEVAADASTNCAIGDCVKHSGTARMGDGKAEVGLMRVTKVVALVAGMVASLTLVACASDTSSTVSSTTGQTGSGPKHATTNTEITAGRDHICALTSGGTVKCWGSNMSNEFGNETSTSSSVPVAVSGLSGVTAIDAGDSYTCALMVNAKVQCWGINKYGTLGNGRTSGPQSCNGNACSKTPVTVSGLTGATAISAGAGHTCALMSGGTVQCWGYNYFGQLGNGSATGSPIPVTVSGLTGATAISAGAEHTCALMSDGTVQCWGRNDYGQLANGGNTGPEICSRSSDAPGGSCSKTPVTVSGLTGATAISAGAGHTCALMSGGTVQCWGSSGALGDDAHSSSGAPVTVTGLTGAATAISAGTGYSCALLSGGTVQCWGYNNKGQLGNGSNTGPETCGGLELPCSKTPMTVSGMSGVTAIAAGNEDTCAVQSESTIMCWGSNDYGQLGNGTNTDSNVPVSVTGL